MISHEKPPISRPAAIAGTSPKRSSAGSPASARFHAAAEISWTLRSIAPGSVHAAASIATAPLRHTVVVAAAAPAAPHAGSPRCPPTHAQASTPLIGSWTRLTAITRRGRLIPSRK